jgi:hypothetical protein
MFNHQGTRINANPCSLRWCPLVSIGVHSWLVFWFQKFLSETKPADELGGWTNCSIRPSSPRRVFDRTGIRDVNSEDCPNVPTGFASSLKPWHGKPVASVAVYYAAKNYSSRKAIIGSTRMARRAGT